jgi:hypothetical protein
MRRYCGHGGTRGFQEHPEPKSSGRAVVAINRCLHFAVTDISQNRHHISHLNRLYINDIMSFINVSCQRKLYIRQDFDNGKTRHRYSRVTTESCRCIVHSTQHTAHSTHKKFFQLSYISPTKNFKFPNIGNKLFIAQSRKRRLRRVVISGFSGKVDVLPIIEESPPVSELLNCSCQLLFKERETDGGQDNRTLSCDRSSSYALVRTRINEYKN